MKPSKIWTILVVGFALVLAGSSLVTALEMELSDEAKAEIQKMGDVAYLSVFELGSG
jgi:hypothetical protein